VNGLFVTNGLHYRRSGTGATAIVDTPYVKAHHHEVERKRYFNRSELFVALWDKSDENCGICGKPVDLKIAAINHMLPICRGGSNDFDNLQIAHHRCNTLKGNMTQDECQAEIQRRWSPGEDQTALIEQLQRENRRLWEANERLTWLLDQEQQLALRRLILRSGYEVSELPETSDSFSIGDDEIDMDSKPEQVADIWETPTQQDVIAWWAKVEAHAEGPGSTRSDDSTTAGLDTPPRPWWRFWG
jgi:5-methylcytosine-specific restriction endonuclease McrA